MLSKLAYLMLCRSIQLLVLLARRDAPPRTWSLWCCATSSASSIARSHGPSSSPADRVLLAAISRVLPRSRWSCFLVKPETLLR